MAAATTGGRDPAAPAPTKVSLSCRQCRQRKIRCDGQVPCSSCRVRDEGDLCEKYEAQRARRPAQAQAQVPAAPAPAAPTALLETTSQGTQQYSEYKNFDGGGYNADEESALLDPPSEANKPGARRSGNAVLPLAFYTSMPNTDRLAALLTICQRANLISPEISHFNLEKLYMEAYRTYGASLASSLPEAGEVVEGPTFSGSFYLSCVLLFASALNGCEPYEEFQALYNSNLHMRREITYWPLDLSILQGFQTLAMALVWSSHTDEAFRVAEVGLRSAVTMGIHHAPILATFPEQQRGHFLDALLNLSSQACLAHTLYGARLPLDPSLIDIDGLLAQCTSVNGGYIPNSTTISRFKIHAKSFCIIEPYFNNEDGGHIQAPSPDEILNFKSVLHARGEEQCYKAIDQDIIDYLNQSEQMLASGSAADVDEMMQRLDHGNTKLMILSIRFLRMMICYPFAYAVEKLPSTIISICKSIFDSAMHANSAGEDTVLCADRSSEIYVMISLQCISFLQRFKSVQQEQQSRFPMSSGFANNAAFSMDELISTLNYGMQLVFNLSTYLRVESSAFKNCQALISQQQQSASVTPMYYSS